MESLINLNFLNFPVEFFGQVWLMVVFLIFKKS